MQSQVQIMCRCRVGLNPLKGVQSRAPTSLCHGHVRFGRYVLAQSSAHKSPGRNLLRNCDKYVMSYPIVDSSILVQQPDISLRSIKLTSWRNHIVK